MYILPHITSFTDRDLRHVKHHALILYHSEKTRFFSGSSSATDFICVIIFHCLGLTHEMKMGK